MTNTAFTPSSMEDTDADAQSRICWSRSGGLLSQSGNADAELKTRVSDGAADDFRKLAREFGMNTSEFLRLLVLTRIYGASGVARMTEDQLARVAGVGPVSVPAAATP